MPTYEYQCKSCNHRFEIWQKMADDALTVCPECNGTIRRILFPAGIVFKGSGFYKTDHGSSAAVNESNHNGQKDKQENQEKETVTTKAESGTEKKSSNEKKSSSDEKTSKPAPASDSKVSAAAD
jgi:putative FmdB family regulatory protein